MAIIISQPFRLMLATAGALAVLSGCAGAPVQEMSNARQAIRAAREAGGEQAAPDKMREAQTLLSDAEENLHKRMYRSARRAAVDARTKASEVLESAQSQKKAGNG